jgi:hypothetical protein
MMFENWCALKGLQPVPANPKDVARFIADCATLGIEKLWPVIAGISKAHEGLADPTLGNPVAAAINKIAMIDPPRSWPVDRRAQFQALPYDLQIYVVEREKQRDKAVRRCQNETADLRNKLVTLQSLAKGKSHEIYKHTSAR